ncbi:adenylate cyclase-like protein [Leishmania mexicana MHOM/GT/2001/U1103]|uniref:Adenylate cyclase-like protein n=1 Tax=Leishmania mexicana (strain MHOM/GT/2001/U1103) TaxID=929439 RepID=E9AZH0_LEIMU|nr:adenylate cyclase-like protein [Leishmania mexicana MHOM/GT/2001/U1103]CBZ28370.1 adenylate cyclase-like protein [Leishmania mexicana MHOM/GT/2001/U1103]
MGAGASHQRRWKIKSSMGDPDQWSTSLPVEVLTASENCGGLRQNGSASSTAHTNLNSRRQEMDSWNTRRDSKEFQDEVDEMDSLQANCRVPNEQAFHDTLVSAAHLLRARQRDTNASISKAEMEGVIVLTRELENLRQMTKRSEFTVEGTWRILEDEGMVEQFGQQLYDELLTRNRRLRVHFYGVDIEEQSKSLLRMVGTAVHFYQKPQLTVDMFTKAGARHRGYGVNAEVFVEMRNAFMRVFSKFVGTDVFQAAEEEWQKFWKYVLDLLVHGSESPEGERYGKVHEEKMLKKIQADFKLIMERQNKCDLRRQFVSVMYNKAIEMHGELSKFEALKDLRASTRVLQSFIDVINNIHDKKLLDEYMRELGGRHTAYNVTVENLHAFTEPFLFTCRHFLEDEWNIAVESRFLWLFEYMIDGISAGMVSDINSIVNLRAPSNSVSFGLIFTDIESSTRLWSKDSKSMSLAVKSHHAMIRRLIADYGAYEVKTVGDSFIIATKDVLVAVKLSLAIQLELMRIAPIAPGFEMVDSSEGHGDPQAWDDRTLRVRIGVEHCTDATATYDTIHRRYDYYGASVNRCARIESAACGGQILLSRESFEHLKSIPEFHDEPCSYLFRSVEVATPPPKVDSRGLDHFVVVNDVGLASFKGIAEPVRLVSLVPRCLAGRQFMEKFTKVSE